MEGLDHPSVAIKPGRGSRKPAQSSQFSMRGSIVHGDQEISFESYLERKHALVLLAHPATADLIEQPPAIQFSAAEGKKFPHTFDFLWIRKDKSRFLVFSKPASLLERGNCEALVRLMAEQLDPQVADGIILFTDKHLTPVAVANATQIHAARKRRDLELERQTSDFFRCQNSGVRIDAAMLLLGNRAFQAALCLIGDGILEAIAPGYLDRNTVVRPR